MVLRKIELKEDNILLKQLETGKLKLFIIMQRIFFSITFTLCSFLCFSQHYYDSIVGKYSGVTNFSGCKIANNCCGVHPDSVIFLIFNSDSEYEDIECYEKFTNVEFLSIESSTEINEVVKNYKKIKALLWWPRRGGKIFPKHPPVPAFICEYKELERLILMGYKLKIRSELEDFSCLESVKYIEFGGNIKDKKSLNYIYSIPNIQVISGAPEKLELHKLKNLEEIYSFYYNINLKQSYNRIKNLNKIRYVSLNVEINNSNAEILEFLNIEPLERLDIYFWEYKSKEQLLDEIDIEMLKDEFRKNGKELRLFIKIYDPKIKWEDSIIEL